MKKSKILGIKPSRKGRYCILLVKEGEIFLTREEASLMPEGASEVLFTKESSYQDSEGEQIPFPDGERLIFQGFALPQKEEELRLKASIAREFSLAVSL